MKLLEMYSKVIGDLQKTEYFKDFTFLKSRRIYIQKDNLGSFWVRFRPLLGIKNHEYSLELDFGIARRYDILHKWFEPLSIFPLKQQREYSTVGFAVWRAPKKKLSYDFLLDGSDYNEVFNDMYEKLVPQCQYQQNRFKTLQDMYDIYISEILKGNLNILEHIWGPDCGIFEWMALSIIIDPINYPIVKNAITDYIDKKLTQKDPSYLQYADKFHEIFNYLENYDFSKELKKCGL